MLVQSFDNIPAYSEEAMKLKIEYGKLIESLDETDF